MIASQQQISTMRTHTRRPYKMRRGTKSYSRRVWQETLKRERNEMLRRKLVSSKSAERGEMPLRDNTMKLVKCQKAFKKSMMKRKESDKKKRLRRDQSLHLPSPCKRKSKRSMIDASKLLWKR